jgi:hypothetical protein
MGFSFTVTNRVLLGNVKIVYGTFANSGSSTGGSIETNLSFVENFILTHIGSAIVTDAPVLNGTLETAGGKKIIPLTGSAGAVTIVTKADSNGFWTAFGV